MDYSNSRTVIEKDQAIALLRAWVDAGSYDKRTEEFTASKLEEMQQIEQAIAGLGFTTERRKLVPYNLNEYELRVSVGGGALIGIAKTSSLPEGAYDESLTACRKRRDELYAQALENAKVNGDKPVDWNARAKMLAQRIEEGIKERLEIYREAAQKTSISRKALDETYLTAEQVVEEIVNQELNLFETTVIYLKDDTKS